MSYITNTIITDIFIAILSIFALIYLYFKFVFTYWSRKGVPYLKPTFPFGNVKEFTLKQKCAGEVFQDIYNELLKRKLPFGGFYSVGLPQLMICDPELVKTIVTKEFQHFHDRDHVIDEKNDPLTTNLLAQKGIKWKKLRSKLTPAFTSGQMKQMYERFSICSELLTEVIGKWVERGDVIDIKEFLARFTTDIIGSCAFGIECNSLTNPDAEFRKQGVNIIQNTFWAFLMRMLNGTNVRLLKLLKLRQFTPETTKFFTDLVTEIVEHREKNKVDRKDIMNLLIQLKNNVNIDNGEKDDIIKTEEVVSSDGLTMAEITGQAFVFFFAGFETSSSTMTFCLYELAYNQEIQDKVREEIENAVNKYNGELSYDAIMEMTYLDQVIKETLRKYPVAPALSRICVKDFKIPETNITIEKGTSIVIPTLGLHRNPEFYPDPMKFDPDRFTNEEYTSRHRYTYLPFGEGPRICIGMRFGLLQTKVGIASLMRKYKFTLDSRTQVPLELDKKNVLLSTDKPILLRATKV